MESFLKATALRTADATQQAADAHHKALPAVVSSTLFTEDAEETPAQRTKRLHFAACVEDLFDDYAPNFEQSLVKELGYDVPAVLEAALTAISGDSTLSSSLAVDLGCGTGLAGVALRRHISGRLIGCDLSRRMLSRAAKKGCYAQLEALDCVAFLERHVATGAADLIVAADVFVYMRSLAPLFASTVRCLRPGGLFAFSTERCDVSECGGAGWVERPSERIAHCTEYLEWLVRQSEGSLVWRSLEEVVVRRDSGTGLRGHVAVLVRV